MKRLIATMLSLFFVFAVTCALILPTCALDMTQRGYPEEYLNTLNEEQKTALTKIAEENDLMFLSMKSIPDEYEETDMVLIYSGVLRQENDITYIDRIFVTVDYGWRFVPEDRNRDTITMVLDSPDFYFGSSFRSTDYMLNAKTNEWDNGKIADEPHLRSDRELTYHANIKFGGAKTDSIGNLRGTAYFDLIPTVSIEYDKTNEFTLDMSAYYNHVIPAPSVLQTDGPMVAAKLLFFVLAVLAVPVVLGIIWEKLWKEVL